MYDIEKHAKELNDLIAENKSLKNLVKELETTITFTESKIIDWSKRPKEALSIGFNKRNGDAVWVCQGHNSFNYKVININTRWGEYISYNHFHQNYLNFPQEK